MQKLAILLVNLGTPTAPTLKGVFRYLNEFLTDERVIDLPWWRRQLLVRGAIVPARLYQSTKSYQSIWTSGGSPLMVWGQKVKEELQKAMENEMGKEAEVALAMRYQEPSIGEELAKLMQGKPEHLAILPLFPQYASATTGSVQQKVMEHLAKYTKIPTVTFISQFATHPAFHEAFCQVALEQPIDSYDHLLFSYHGLPEKEIKKDDTYLNHCRATTEGVVKSLGLSNYSVCFQSRLGKEPWLKPYASNHIVQLAREGKRRVLVFCPSFVCDCLETLYEIGVEYAHLFKKAGGESFDLCPGLNAHPAWILALQKILLSNIIFK